jgi:hypothetical protein
VSNTKSLVERDAKALDREISHTVAEIKELDFQDQYINRTITEKVQYIAELLEEKMNLAGTPEFINTICSLILRMFADAGLGHRDNTVLNALPNKYKLLRKSTSHLSSAEDRPTEESIRNFIQLHGFFKLFNGRDTDLVQFTKRQLQDIASDVADAEDKITEFCNENSIKTVSSSESYSWIDGLQANKPPTTTLQKAPDAITSPNDDAKAWFRLSEICQKVGQARMDYPNHDPKRLYDEANAVRAWCNLLEPIINRKYRYDPGQMNDMLHEAVEQSGTAAASHSGVICSSSINPKTGKPELRKITKEQLDAICLPFFNCMNAVRYGTGISNQAIRLAYEQFRAEDQRYLAERAHIVGPKLQKIK